MAENIDFDYNKASLEDIIQHVKDTSDGDKDGALKDAYYYIGRNHIAWGYVDKPEIYNRFTEILSDYASTLNSNPDSAYRKLITELDKRLEAGIQDGKKLMPLEDQEFPLHPSIAKDFRRDKQKRRMEPTPGEAQIFMKRLIGETAKFNIRSQTVYLDNEPQTVPERDAIRFREKYGWAPTKGYDSLIYGFSRANEFDPVKNYLDGLELMDVHSSDYQEIRDNVLFMLLGIDPAEGNNWLYQRYLRMWLVAAVTRVYRPGAKFDSTLVLQGPKGYRKSSFFNALGTGKLTFATKFDPNDSAALDRWVYDVNCKSIGNGDNKDSLMICHRNWLVVLDEIDQLSQRESGMVKNFLQKEEDQFRVPYGRVSENFPRRFVFGGTTNIAEYLSDPDPDRRYLTIPITNPVPVDDVLAYRDLIWSWAKTALFNGTELTYLTDHELQLHSQLYLQHTMEGEYDAKIQAFISFIMSDSAFKGSATSSAVVFKINTLYEVFDVPNGKYAKREFKEALERFGFKSGQRKHGSQNLGQVWWHRDQDFSLGIAPAPDTTYSTLKGQLTPNL
jgi:hypothetical protein